MGPSVTLQDVRRAQSSIAHLVLKTPMLPARSLGDLAGCELLLKAEKPRCLSATREEVVAHVVGETLVLHDK